MNTRNTRSKQRAPFGVSSSVKPRLDLIEQAPNPAYDRHPACVTLPERTCRHPLTDLEANEQLGRCEDSVKNRFDRVTPFLQVVAGIPLGLDYVTRVQELAQSSLGHTLPEELLEDNWISGHNLKGIFGYATAKALTAATEQFSRKIMSEKDDSASAIGFFLDCGFHAVDISPCADGRLKGLLPYILRLPLTAFTYRKAYAGSMFDIEDDLAQWEKNELRRYREGVPNTADQPTRYLKIAVYHFSTSDPTHSGCAAHGSNDRAALEAALTQLMKFREAVENAHCCGASIDILLIGVDTDTDSIRVHIPDSKGFLNPYRYVDNTVTYAQTLHLAPDEARVIIHEAILNANRSDGWAKGNGVASEGMRRFIGQLLINNLSQIDYVVNRHGGRYPPNDIGHAERYISVGDGFDEVQIRNLAYYAHLDTVEENAIDVDVGIKIFTKLNLNRGLPIPIAIHYRYDPNVPGSRERTVVKARRVYNAIKERFSSLDEQNLLQFRLSVQAQEIGSPIEEVASA
ncbi:MAG: carboxysome shell carbonic anhydrase [Halothiobacillus sp. 14-55-98]|jgi:carboxysome shell carbonic anhydrase|nr:MAG: carboxysome shell carbonic anhydrase [Halothiobacillus sp. 14-55-98]